MVEVFERLRNQYVTKYQETAECRDSDLDEGLFEVEQNDRDCKYQSSIHKPHVVLRAHFNLTDVLINVEGAD